MDIEKFGHNCVQRYSIRNGNVFSDEEIGEDKTELTLGPVYIPPPRDAACNAAKSSPSLRDSLSGMLFYRRYLRWAVAIGDARGVSHANMCLARVCKLTRDHENFSLHVMTSLDDCQRRGDLDNQGKVMQNSADTNRN